MRGGGLPILLPGLCSKDTMRRRYCSLHHFPGSERWRKKREEKWKCERISIGVWEIARCLSLVFISDLLCLFSLPSAPGVFRVCGVSDCMGECIWEILFGAHASFSYTSDIGIPFQTSLSVLADDKTLSTEPSLCGKKNGMKGRKICLFTLTMDSSVAQKASFPLTSDSRIFHLHYSNFYAPYQREKRFTAKVGGIQKKEKFEVFLKKMRAFFRKSGGNS